LEGFPDRLALTRSNFHPQPLGDFAEGTTRIDFQQRQNAPKQVGITGPS
jgi:hypothetical protein